MHLISKKTPIFSLFFLTFFIFSCGESKFLDSFKWDDQTQKETDNKHNPIETEIYLIHENKEIFDKYVTVTGSVTAVLENSGFYIQGVSEKLSGIWIEHYLPIWPEIGDLIELTGLVRIKEKSLYIISRNLRYINNNPDERVILEAKKLEENYEALRGALVEVQGKITEENNFVYLKTAFERNLLLGQKFVQKYPYILGANYKMTGILDETLSSYIFYPRRLNEYNLLDQTPNLPKEKEKDIENLVLRNLRTNLNFYEQKTIRFYSYVTALSDGGLYVQDSSLCYDASWVSDSNHKSLSRGDHILVTAHIDGGVINAFASQKIMINKRFYSALTKFVCEDHKNKYCPYFHGTLSEITGKILEEKEGEDFILQNEEGKNIYLQTKISSGSFCPGENYSITGFFDCDDPSRVSFDPRSTNDIKRLSDGNCDHNE